MTPAAFKAWRERMKLTQREAAEALGLNIRTISNYESGFNPVPKHVALACAAIAHGIPPIQ